MREQGNPPRLFEDGSLDPALRAALDVARRDSLSLVEARQWADRAVQTLPTTTGAGAPSVSVVKSLWIKLGALAVLVGAGAVWILAAQTPRTSMRPKTVDEGAASSTRVDASGFEVGGSPRKKSGERSSVPEAPGPENRPEQALPEQVGHAPEGNRPLQPNAEVRELRGGQAGDMRAQSNTQRSSRTRSSDNARTHLRRAATGSDATKHLAPRVATVSSPDTSADAELALLMRAQGAAAVSPERSLALLEVHRRTYPHGAFSEERDALSIDALALMRSKSRGTAQEQAAEMALRREVRDFLVRYPQSPHRARIGRLALDADP